MFFGILRFHLTVLYLSSSSSDNKERFCKVYSIKFFKRVISPIEYYNKHLAHNGLNILLGNRALMQWLQYRKQEVVLQYYIKRELPLLFSYFRTLSMEMLQDITESLLNQTHISFRKCQGCWSSASRRLPSSYRMQSPRRFCNHGSGWLWQKLSQQ